MPFAHFLEKQLIDILQWNEAADGVLSYRYPVLDMEIQSGARLTVRDSQMAVFVNEGRIADVFTPGLYTLTTRNLPLLTDILSWSTSFESPFKSDLYFFSTRLQINQKWGTATPITIRDKEFGAVRLRGYGSYSYRIVDPRAFLTTVSGTRDMYLVSDLEGHLRNIIVTRITDILAASDISFLDMAASLTAMSDKLIHQISPSFTTLGLELVQFNVESVSLPEELQKTLDQRISMNMVGDLSRFTQFAAAESLPIAAANIDGVAGLGMGVGVGTTLMKTLTATLPPVASMTVTGEPISEATVFCNDCRRALPLRALFCPACGKAQ